MTPSAAEQQKALPLGPIHEAMKARFLPLASWLVPAHYGDPEAEYWAAHQAVGLFDATFLTLVTAEGKDVIEYLNRRLSQRTLAMQPGDGLRANQLNGDGRMEADLEVYRLDENRSWLVAPPAVTGEYLQFLADKYVFSEDARFVDATGEWVKLALVGPSAEAALAAVGVALPVENRRIGAVQLHGRDGWILRSAFLTDAWVICLPVDGAEAAHATLAKAVSEQAGRLLGFLAFDTIRVEAGVAWWGIDLTERSIPLEADLHSAIHTNKGCYPGQETIAKILNLGHPARKLVGIVWESGDPPAAGTALLRDGAEVGKLTSSTWSPSKNQSIGLAMVRWQAREEGGLVELADGRKGRVVSLPFVR